MANRELEADISGVGDIVVYEHPKQIIERITGVGEIEAGEKTLKGVQMKKQLFLLILIWQGGGFATVDIAGAGEEQLLQKKPVKKDTKKKIPARIIMEETKQMEIEGYAGTKYVRFVVDVINNKLVTGRMVEKDGEGKSVHGELIDDVLYLNVGHFTVVIPE